MAEPHPSEGSSSGSVSAGSSDSVVELNIKTLDSQMYSFQVDKNIPVSVFKENVASKTGVPVEQQRLIFRGKVLKDNHLLSEYQVDNGHTLHLVARQPSQPQSSSGTSSGETATDGGDRAGQETNAAGVPRSRVGQVSHSVLLGSFNVGDQLDNSVPDLSQVIGAVLNSIGVGSQTTVNGSSGMQPTTMAPQGNGTERRQGPTADQIREINQLLRGPGPVPSGQSMPQVLPIPLGAAIPIPTINQPIPDSLHTLSEFMNRMELTLSQNGRQSDQPLNDTGVQPPVNLPANTRGVPTPEALVAVLRLAERLFSDHAIGALSRIAGRLEQEGGSADPTIRAQIQSESMRVGLVMQHLGALLLELGRTMLTLRMGQSSSESSVNSGPAVYISPFGPNPIMVQPSSLQTGSLFGGPVASPLNPGVFVPGGAGLASRHVNIHIHTAVGPRTTNGEGMQGDLGSGISSADPGQPRVLPVRNIVTAAVPSQPSVISVTNAAQSGDNLSQQSASSVPLSTIIAGVGSQIRNYLGNMQSQDLGSSAHQESSGNQVQSVASGTGNNDRGNNVTSVLDTGRELPLPGHSSDTDSHMAQGEGQKNCNKEESADRAEESSGSSVKGVGNQVNSSDNTNSTPISNQGVNVPLGLGLGGLQPRRRSRVLNSRGVVGAGATSNTPNDASQHNRSEVLSAGQPAGASSTVIPRVPVEGLSAGDQDDTANVMSQVLSSPAMDGLLAGVSRQTGVGSPDVLRNMLGQLTQNPAMMNTVNQIAQQMEGQDFGGMFGGSSGGGGIDLSRMFQQMMPIVSQALGSGSAFPQPAPFPQSAPALGHEVQPTNSGARLSRDEKDRDQSSQIDLQRVVQGLEHENRPEEVLRSVAESVLGSNDYGSGAEGLVNELCAEDGLASEFMEMLLRDLSQRVQNETDSTGEEL